MIHCFTSHRPRIDDLSLLTDRVAMADNFLPSQQRWFIASHRPRSHNPSLLIDREAIIYSNNNFFFFFSVERQSKLNRFKFSLTFERNSWHFQVSRSSGHPLFIHIHIPPSFVAYDVKIIRGKSKAIKKIIIHSDRDYRSWTHMARRCCKSSLYLLT